MGQIDEIVSEQFARWERRGRGYAVWPHPVSPEPPFRPFLGYTMPDSDPEIDDGRVPTPIASFFDAIHRKLNPKPPRIRPEPEEEPEPDWQDGLPEIAEIQAALPGDLRISKEAFEQFLMSLPESKNPLGFEIVGTSDTTTVLFAVPEDDALPVQLQLEAHFPEAIFRREGGLLRRAWDTSGGERVILEFGLAREFMVPLLSLKSLTLDPLVGIVGAMGELSEGERAVLQVMFQPVSHPWAESVWNAVTDSGGDPLFVNYPELTTHAKFKISRPLYAAVLRVGTKADNAGRALELARLLAGVFRKLSGPESNSLVPLENEDDDPDTRECDLLNRQSRRTGMLLNCDELVSLVHLPTPGVRSPKLVRQGKRTKALPQIAMNQGGLVLGENTHAGKTRLASLSSEQRVQHTHVIGASGTGKSTLLLNIILQDIRAGRGVGVLDPHGDLIETIIGQIPKARIADVVLLDASDEDFPIGFNILSAHSRLEKTLLASDLVSVFRRQSTTWGDQMTGVLGNAILAFLESSRGGTLIDLRRFLVEPNFRAEFLPTVTDQEVVYFWKKEFPLLAGRPHVSLLTRLNTLLRPKPIRYMLGQKENRLDFAEIMNTGKIFLAKLPQGEIGEENAFLLGALIVSKFQQLVIARQAMKDSLRRDFFLCLDECHQFLTPSMATILCGARKYRLGLLLAHQELHQLDKEPDVGSAVRANPLTRICFRVGDQDANKLEEGFSFFAARDLQNLGRGEAICRVERSDYDFNLTVLPPQAGENAETGIIREAVIAASRARYATPRADVEARFFKIEIDEPPGREPPQSPPLPTPPIPTVPIIPKDETTGPKMEPLPPVSTPVPHFSAPEPAEMGRGGREHRYVQHLIKQLAIGLNFEVEVEKQILGGEGAVDVLVKKGERLCAFEISVTNSPEHELQHIENCFKAGIQEVVVVCLDEEKLTAIRQAAGTVLAAAEMERLSFYITENLSTKLIELAASSKSTEVVSHGRKTKVSYRALSTEEARLKREALAQITAGSIRKLKGK